MIKWNKKTIDMMGLIFILQQALPRITPSIESELPTKLAHNNQKGPLSRELGQTRNQESCKKISF